MDEPFGALDPVIRGKAQDDLLAIQKQFGTTVILVTHDMDEAFHLGDRIAVMSEGKLLQCSTPEKILTEPADPFVQQLTGTSDRALKLMSMLPLKASMEPAKAGLGLGLPQIAEPARRAGGNDLAGRRRGGRRGRERRRRSARSRCSGCLQLGKRA